MRDRAYHIFLVWVPALLALTAACSAAPFVCRNEALRAVLPTVRVVGEDALNDTLAGNLESDEALQAEFEALESAFEGQDINSAAAWYMERGLDQPLRVSFLMATPARQGDVFQVSHVSFRPLWGTVPETGALFAMGIEMNDFTATSITGTARVVGVDPFRMEVDVVASNDGRQVPIRGTLVIRHETMIESCFE
jgi:hypothetical protein